MIGRAETLTVRRVGRSYTAEARLGPFWAAASASEGPAAVSKALADLEAQLPVHPKVDSILDDLL